MCAAWAGWLGLAGWWTYFLRQPANTAAWNVLAGSCLVGWVALDHLKLDERAQRYGKAAKALDLAIVRYEASSDRPMSTLTEAAEQARDTAHAERIRAAPAWIRDQRRRYRLRFLGWVSPAALALALQIADAHWQCARPWQVFSVGLVLLAGAMFKTRKLREASHTLGEAIERYQFESAATESDLEQAGKLATDLLAARSGPAEPAA
jgi:hypothetical protein